MNEPGYTLNSEAIRRLARALRHAERQPRGPNVRRQTPPRQVQPSWYAITKTVITAGNQTAKTLGKGMIQIQLVTFDTSDNASYDDCPGIPEVTAYNGGDSIGIGRLVQVKVICGRYSIDVDYC